MNSQMEKQLSPLIDKIRAGNVALFLGAGASVSAGLPSGAQLTDYLKKHFSACNQELVEFMDVCQDIEETPPFDSAQLHNFIKEKLDLYHITEAHKTLTKYPWSAIFTTNFDTVIETAYNITEQRYKSCYPVVTASPSVNISDRTKIHLFKMMGTVDSYDPSTSMVLTRSDYHNNIVKRNHYLKLLADFIKSGTVLYIGYSFKDLVVRDVISGLSKLYGLPKIPWSYMLLKDEIPTDTKSQFFFNSNRIIPIQADFDSFFSMLDQSANLIAIPQLSRPKATLNVLGKHITIDEDSYNMYGATFDFLHEEILQTSQCDINEFLRGRAKCWIAYQNNWDFRRSVHNEKDDQLKLMEVIKGEIRELDAAKNRILYISGMPGCGKTIYTYRVGYDIYIDYKLPVVFFAKNSIIDFKTVSSFIEDVNEKYEKFLAENEKVRTVKVILVFDDVSSNLKDVTRLNDFLISRGRSALIIANGRYNELELNARSTNVTIDKKDVFYVRENLNGEESNTIINYLFQHKFITSKSSRWEVLISETYSNSFFATFYSLVHPSRRPLDEIIRDQFNNLSSAAKEAYLNISCFSQFDIPINIELLVRSLDISYEEFYDILKDVEKIIFEEIDYNGNVLYQTHHRIIAQKTLEFFASDRNKLFERYKKICEKSLLFNSQEKLIIENLLIDNFSTKLETSYFTDQQKKELFIAACQNSATRTLKHHLGLIEMQLEEFESAEDHLLDALDLPRESSELYKGESDQNILTSLGKLNSTLAIRALKNQDYQIASEKFRIAEDFFNDAKHGDYSNVYAYHANAHMWFQKAKNEIKLSDRAQSISKCLEIIDLAKDNLNQNEVLPLVDLEALVWTSIGDDEEVKAFIQKISDQYNTANGYFIYAYYHYRKAINSGEFKDLYFDVALKTLNDGLEKHPRDEKCSYLKCKILLLRDKTSKETLYDLLGEWRSVASQDNAFLLYNYARIAFILGYFDQANDLFQELDRGVGLGNKNRTKAANAIQDEQSSLPKVYSGEVTDIYSKYDGNIKVTSSSSKLSIKFLPVTAKFTVYRGAYVKFNIGFSYRGPIAFNVIKG